MEPFSYRTSSRSPMDRDRDRSWNGRDDRSRESYRTRSPVDRRERRRSRSPPGPPDRYEPRRRDDYLRDPRDDRGRRSPPPIDRYVPNHDDHPHMSTGPLQNPIKDPWKIPYQVGYSYFSAWWKMNDNIEIEKERRRTGRRSRVPLTNQEEKPKIQAAYDTYKIELQAKMARDFVADHHKEQWFRERYVAETRDPLRALLRDFRRGLYGQWEQDLESGVFDEFTLEGIPKSEVSNGGMVEKEEGEATATNEVLGVGDLVPVPGSDIRDESLSQPTLLIKTIAPHVSRQNLEKFCRELLGEDEGGYKWLSLSDPNPSKRFHRIGWVMLHAAESDSAGAPTEDGDASSTSTAQKALEAVNGKTVKDEIRGDFVCHVGVHNPPANPRKKALWDLFSAPERIERDLGLAQRLVDKFEHEYGTDLNANLKISERVEELRNMGRLQPVVVAAAAARTRRGRAKREDEDEDMDAAMEDDGGGDDDVDDGEYDDDVDDENLLAQKKRLDLSIEYLRRVFNFCFFCVFESDSVHELTRKCPGGHLRRPRAALSSAAKEVALASINGDPFPSKIKSEPNEEGEVDSDDRRNHRNPLSKADQQLLRAYNWVKTFEDKIGQLLQPDAADLRRLGGRDVEEAMQDEMSKHVKQEDEGKWRCKAPDCSKLFKEEHFWRKHVEKRHAEWADALRENLELINAYVLDPSHIAPSRTDANSNGHFPQTGQTPAGTPRGFNLQSMATNSIPPGVQPGMWGPGFPPLMASSPASSPWGRDENTGPGGPVRRGLPASGGRFNAAYRTGPYDRRPPGARYEGSSRAAGSVRPGAAALRWADGGQGGVPPKEAVQGRSIKSYEDLDAVGNAGGELNY